MKKQMRKRSAFTLVELLIVMAVLGVIAAIIIPNLTKSVDSAREKVAIERLKVSLWQLI